MHLEIMLKELLGNSLEVILIPSRDEDCARDGGKIRVAVETNIDWYSDICSQYPKAIQPKRNKPQTSIKKEDVVYVIRKMIENKKSRSRYAKFLIEEVQSRIESEIEFVPFNDQF